MNVLFVCSKNKWRSLTAEKIFEHNEAYQIKSAGTDEGARIKLTEKHLAWANIVFVMEKKHRQLIQQKFAASLYTDKIIVLDIADEYQYMDEELILSLKTSVAGYLDDLV